MLGSDYNGRILYNAKTTRIKNAFGDFTDQDYTLPSSYTYKICYRHYEAAVDTELNFQQSNSVIELCVNLGSTVPIIVNDVQMSIEKGSYMFRSLHKKADTIKLVAGNTYELLTIEMDPRFVEYDINIPQDVKYPLVVRRFFGTSISVVVFDKVLEAAM